MNEFVISPEKKKIMRIIITLAPVSPKVYIRVTNLGARPGSRGNGKILFIKKITVLAGPRVVDLTW